MFALLYDPVSEIKKAKKQSYAKILMYLLTASLFCTAGIFFVAQKYFGGVLTPNMLIYGIFGLLFSVIIAQIVLAFFLSFALHILDGDGGYYEGLTMQVLSMVTPALAIFFGGAILFIPYGVILSVILWFYGFIIGAATFFRAGKELFDLGYAGVLVGTLITYVPVIYFIFLLL